MASTRSPIVPVAGALASSAALFAVVYPIVGPAAGHYGPSLYISSLMTILPAGACGGWWLGRRVALNWIKWLQAVLIASLITAGGVFAGAALVLVPGNSIAFCVLVAALAYFIVLLPLFLAEGLLLRLLLWLLRRLGFIEDSRESAVVS